MAERSVLLRSRRWRALRRLLPRWYRHAYGNDVLHAHVDAHGDAGAAGLRFWLGLAWDVALTALQLRADGVMAWLRGSHSVPGGVSGMATHAWRGVVRDRSFAAAVVLTLGLGIGAVATMFTVLDRLLLSPPAHVVDADDVRRIYVHGESPFTRTVDYSGGLSWPDYEDLRATGAFSDIAAYSSMSLTMGLGDEAEVVRAELASASYFALLGVAPAAGRFFTDAEDRIDAPEAGVVLSHEFWQRRFGGGQVLGRELRIGKGAYAIAGIAPRGFTGVDIAPVDVWLPLLAAQSRQAGTEWSGARRWYWFSAIVRLDTAMDADAAAQAATLAYRQGRSSVPGADPEARLVLSPIIAARGPKGSDEARVAQLLTLLAALVLVIACANVANLALARGIRRRRMLALRSALGASRARLAGELLLETALLAVVAGGVAVLFARGVAPLLFRALMPDALLVDAVSMRLLAVAVAGSAGCIALAGVLPAWRSTRFNLVDALRAARQTQQSVQLRRALLFGQAALSAVLLAGAGMFLRSLEQARALDMGLDLDAVAVQFEMSDGTRFGPALADVAYAARDRLRTLPWVESAAVTTLPQFNGFWGVTLSVGGDTLPATPRGPWYFGADGDYFAALGLDIVRGRALTDADDRAGARVAVVSESLARALFRDGDAVGSCIGMDIGDDGCVTIVGVVEDVLPSIRADAPTLAAYMPNRSGGEGLTGGSLIVRTRGAPGAFIDDIAAAARAAH
ncbi:MAG TPA: ABC transporter permease, partial [Longimicrobiales bacterium]|nr:ABC transporter permease [Longimicrobiales bacterium]